MEIIVEIMSTLAASGENPSLLMRRLRRNFTVQNSNVQTLARHFSTISNRYCYGLTDCLKERYPLLSQSDLDFCSLLALGLSSAEISLAYGYDHPATFYNKRHKIRKKMGLPQPTDLEEHLRRMIINLERTSKEALKRGIETKSLDPVLNLLNLQ